MKAILILCFSFLCWVSSSAQSLKPGDIIPEITISNVVNGPDKTISLQSLKGKVIVLDFWATWCAPCIKGFDKLDALKKKFGEEVEIIAVSDESTERIERFIRNRPVGFQIASDPEKKLQKWFPFVSIPHIVIIDAAGKVQAITSGSELTEQVIAQVRNGTAINVSYKSEGSYASEAFPKVAEGEEFFGIKGYQEGIRSGTEISLNSLRYSNTHYTRFYLEAYKILYSRLRFENIPLEEQGNSNENRYSLYLAIKERSYDKLYEVLRKKLAEEFEYKTRIDKEKDTVFIITRTGSPDTSMVRPQTTVASRQTVNKGKFAARNKPIGKAIAEYLEGFGIVDKIVLDETGDTKLHDIAFTWEPEKEGAIDEFLAKLGLKMELAIREYEVLTLYK